MKTKKRSKLRKIFSKVLNVRFWLDWERIKSFGGYLKESIEVLVTPASTGKSEDFKAALHQFHIGEDALLDKQRALFRLSLLMLFLAVLIFSYTIYQLTYGTYRAAVVSLVVMGLALVLAFRYHFWYFQIRQRKLGCTFREWYRALLGVK